jgi:Ni,Fe-hydrogenase III large subunit/Ni,Fe-hydrogenase III component G
MTSLLSVLCSESGLHPEWRRSDEAYANCPEAEFSRHVTALASGGALSDLFATTAARRPSTLTAVLQVTGDPSWLLLSTELETVAYSSLTPGLHAASWYEREILEMHGLEPVGHPAPGPLRLHHWPEDHHPMRDAPIAAGTHSHPPHTAQRPAVTGQGVFQLPLGPVRSGPQESAELLFSSGGEDIVVLDLRLGFKFRAIERLAEGQPADRALQLAERLAGTSAFANGLAFTRAVERAIGVSVAPSAEHTRALLAELERLHHHFGTIARLAEATGLLVAAAQYGILKEEALRSAGRLTEHRYLRGVLCVGGMEITPDEAARDQLRTQIAEWSQRSERLQRLLEQTSTFMDRLDSTAILHPGYASEHNLLGPVGRASGVDRDTRRDHPYASYASVEFDVPTIADGDAQARFQVFAAELAQSLRVMRQLLDGWPLGRDEPTPLHWQAGSALGWAEAPGGESLHWVDLDVEGRVIRWRARPPAVANWHPFAHACSSGNNLTDYPVIEASFAISPAEFDR